MPPATAPSSAQQATARPVAGLATTGSVEAWRSLPTPPPTVCGCLLLRCSTALLLRARLPHTDAGVAACVPWRLLALPSWPSSSSSVVSHSLSPVLLVAAALQLPGALQQSAVGSRARPLLPPLHRSCMWWGHAVKQHPLRTGPPSPKIWPLLRDRAGASFTAVTPRCCCTCSGHSCGSLISDTAKKRGAAG